MHTVHQPPVTDEPPGPRVTPYFLGPIERVCARLGLPRESWPS